MAHDDVASMMERSSERVHFLVARRVAEGAEVLVLRLPDGRTVLPVFGLGEEAGMFLWLEAAGEGWRVAEISERGLAALLRGSCAGVRWILRPFATDGVGRGGPEIVGREDFLGAPSGERRTRGEGAGHEPSPRPPAGGRRSPVRRTCPRPFWLIVKHRTGGMEALRTTLASGEEALAVFGFEEEAGMFLEIGASGGGWRVRETTPGELISVLYGPCAGVGRVALDPLPRPIAQASSDLVSMKREAFVEWCSSGKRSGRWPTTRGVVAGEPRRPRERQLPKGGIAMWSRLFGGDDGLPREKVDAVVRIIDRYLAEEAELRGLQSDRQTVHPKDLPPDKRRALIGEVFAVLGETRKR